ncbi:MAG TPA: ATP-dependent DNA helicase RecG, partial [Burkholderiaceae bacterium]|nr:ATP-dependent DNA helicase RecG [Burkholderiaceae bacterium]
MAEAPAQERTIPQAGVVARASGPARALERLGLTRDIDLALHLPLRYEDETRLTRIADAHDGESAQVEGVVTDARVEFRPRRQLVARIQDESGTLVLRFMNFYPSHQKTLSRGTRVRARGDLRVGFFGREMVHPVFKAVDANTPLAGTLTPVYPTVSQLPQAYLRKAIASALSRAPLAEVLPPDALPSGVPTLRQAVQRLHHPPPDASLASLTDHADPAWQRLKFEELLAQQLSQHEARRERAHLKAPVLRGMRDGLRDRLLGALPFTLTAAQQRVVREIAADLALPKPMHRLLQGDVGSGKTVVAALAAALAIESGWQCALMAPTEILAEQHFRKLVQWLAPLEVGMAWLTGSRKGKGRAQMVERVASGEASLVIGTHAVIQDDVRFAKLGLAIVDEQHRFGVQQRLQLRRKLALQGLEPHLLMMSATPIPRTLAMSYFADLDVSTIDELPPGRQPVVTKLFADSKRNEVVARIRDEVAQGRQVYWVCPLIEESESLDLKNATATHEELCAALPDKMVGLLHGRMPAAEKTAV